MELDKLQTYASEDRIFNLDSSKIFWVANELEEYAQHIFKETGDNWRDKEYHGLAGKTLFGDYKMVVRTQVLDKELQDFDLASLTLKESGRKLTLLINAHPKVIMPPYRLYDIGEEYRKRHKRKSIQPV